MRIRKLVPAIILAIAVLGIGTPVLAGEKPAAPATACISLPEIKLPNVCDIKAGTLKLVADLAAQIKVSVQAVLTLAVNLGAVVGGGLRAGLSIVLSLPPLLVKILCPPTT